MEVPVIRDRDTRVRIGHNINNLKFADDIEMIEDDRNKLQDNMNEERKVGEAAGLKITVMSGKQKRWQQERKKSKSK